MFFSCLMFFAAFWLLLALLLILLPLLPLFGSGLHNGNRTLRGFSKTPKCCPAQHFGVVLKLPIRVRVSCSTVERGRREGQRVGDSDGGGVQNQRKTKGTIKGKQGKLKDQFRKSKEKIERKETN